MKRSSPGPEAPSRPGDSFHDALNLYALAAGAAGVSVLALAQPSEAEILYTTMHQVVGRNGTYGIDLNHDGVIDFTIHDRCLASASFVSNNLKVIPTAGNRVLLSGAATFEGGFAAALVPGEKIGPEHTQYAAPRGALMAGSFGNYGSYVFGYWINNPNHYLGFQFKINGEFHYGWARLTVKQHSSKHRITALLTGFAYETIPNKAILAGQTQEGSAPEAGPQSSNEVLPVPEENALGALALGSAGIPLWRRQPSVETRSTVSSR